MLGRGLNTGWEIGSVQQGCRRKSKSVRCTNTPKPMDLAERLLPGRAAQCVHLRTCYSGFDELTRGPSISLPNERASRSTSRSYLDAESINRNGLSGLVPCTRQLPVLIQIMQFPTHVQQSASGQGSPGRRAKGAGSSCYGSASPRGPKNRRRHRQAYFREVPARNAGIVQFSEKFSQVRARGVAVRIGRDDRPQFLHRRGPPFKAASSPLPTRSTAAGWARLKAGRACGGIGRRPRGHKPAARRRQRR